MNYAISLQELEQAIHYWRERLPSSGEESRLCSQAAALATPYALMILRRNPAIDLAALDAAALNAYQDWRAARG